MMKKVTLSVLALTTAFLVAGCDSGKSGSEQEKVLKVGSTGQSYPSGFKQDNKLVGFDVEVTETIAKDLNYKVEWVTADFSGLMGQLEARKLDTVANVVAITPARQEKYNFAQPYSYYGSQIVTHKDNTDINTLADLKGKTVAGVLGSNHVNNLKKAFADGSVNIRTYETRDGAMNDALSKRVEGYVNSRPILLAEINKRNLPFKLVGEPLVIEEVSFPFHKDENGDALRKQFDAELTKMREDGRLKALAEKYFGEDISVPPKK
ncbi:MULTISPECIES: amino acid ABC transporter substrate-binding protein [Pectobacterium]|uniref:Amino acid ABC transporter substrate-binding protein n=3 Tax=Pectobacterium TaxID=122277 RepID=A0A221T499_9GAMM|nr:MULTISPECIES: amino acid ABC transporter substrate-binding protein [Pectobacterium]AIU90093.1 ABC transporter substrate-binding protein [Pectobacterium odoriferum]ASN83729.1 Amino acid ABC transporter substrate-binding protein [Pectobacterium versatile]AVT60720.1 amino acid ABC transporter binding protein [Pectobacterium versatile]KFW98966.1 ABC transporter substrate-binding protein [Pectobacterium carotovorum subsp. carotovorum]KGA33461.1 ABC transporter substrate-binding protein [Pectobac